MNGEYPFCETDPIADKLRQAAFDAIYRDGCEDCGDWVETLISNYTDEVVDMFGDAPFEVRVLLSDWWDTMDYKDPRTDICLTYRDWAVYFSGEFGHTIYNELIKAKQTNERPK